MTAKRGRPRSKEYDPEAVLSKVIGMVCEVYDDTGEIKATADGL